MALEQVFVIFLTWKQVMGLGVVAYNYNPSTHTGKQEAGGGEQEGICHWTQGAHFVFPKLVTLCFVLEFF